jgi:hypothetical protein
MNKDIIRKCIEELKKKKPDKSYLLGMLEAMSDMSEHVPQREVVVENYSKAIGGSGTTTSSPIFTVPDAVKKETDPTGELETSEQRKARLSQRKVPPVFLGDIRKMHLDPSLTDGKTDVTPIL